MRHGSLFNGIGGFQLAAAWMGWENIMSCEIDEFCNKVTKHHFPNCIQHGDIKTNDFSIYRGGVDIITGGFPCQPFSTAGKRKGTNDDRHLWPEMLRAIREIQPRWVVGENVHGLINWSKGLVFEQVQADLEAEGFEVFPPCILPACAINAPHRRDRVWIVAYCANARIKSLRQERENAIHGSESFANTDSNGQQRSNGKNEINASERREHALNDIEQVRDAADTESIRWKQSRTSREWRAGSQNGNIDVTDTGNTGLQGSKNYGIIGEEQSVRDQQFTRFLRSEWQDFPTQSPLCGRNDGVSNRMERIKALGNAIVPEVAFQIFKTIDQYEQRITEADAVAY